MRQWIAAGLVLAACGPVEERHVGRQEAAIVGGTLAPGDPAVVVLAVNGGGLQEYCTGTLIAPRTVLTAAHCINAYGPGNFYVVGFGPSVAGLSKVVPVAQQFEHPSYNQSSFDFGLLRLSTPVVDVTPIQINDTPLTASDVGRPIRHVGYGITSGGGQDSGTKREVTYNVRQVQRYTMESGGSGKQTCSGDSGGPGFMVMPGSSLEKVVGVVSYGDQSCLVDGFDGRVDVAASWIRQTMAGWEQPTCATDGACLQGCTPVDQDCVCVADGQCHPDCIDLLRDPDCPRDCVQNGVCAQANCPRPDPDCVAIGGSCSSAYACVSRQCVSDAQHPQTYCSTTCTSPGTCPNAMECASGVCRFTLKPEKQPLDACRPADDFCVNGRLCTGPAGGITRCVSPCIVTSDCPQGAVCEAGADSQRYCRPSDVRFTSVVLSSTQAFRGPVAQGCTAVSGLSTLGLAAFFFPALRRRRSSSRSRAC